MCNPKCYTLYETKVVLYYELMISDVYKIKRKCHSEMEKAMKIEMNLKGFRDQGKTIKSNLGIEQVIFHCAMQCA